MPARRKASKSPCSTVPGLASSVTSAGASGNASRMARKDAAGNKLGVPPPKYTVLMLSQRPDARSLAKSARSARR